MVAGDSAAEVFVADGPTRQLADAAARGDAAVVTDLVRRGADPNAAGKGGMTPLIWALAAQSKPGMLALLKAGADPNRQDADKDSPLALATGARDPELLRILLEHGGDPNGPGRDGDPLLFQAVMQHDLAAVRLLADHKANLNARGTGGQTPAMLAADLNQFEIVRYLLERGADWRIEEPGGATLETMVQHSRVSPKFSDKVAALQWVRSFLEAKRGQSPARTVPPRGAADTSEAGEGGA